MVLAIKKEECGPPGNYHYMVHSSPMKTDEQAIMYKRMGYIIVEVEDEQGQDILRKALIAIDNEVYIAYLAEEALGSS